VSPPGSKATAPRDIHGLSGGSLFASHQCDLCQVRVTKHDARSRPGGLCDIPLCALLGFVKAAKFIQRIRHIPMSHRRIAYQNFALLASSALLLSSGCFGSRSADQALTNALAQAGQQKEPIYPLAGNVTIDGQPPHFEKHEALIVMLNEPEKLDTPPTTRRYVETTPSGEFSFSTYEPRDGTKPGKYILTFAILREKGKFGLIGPDKLNNLYNDPDKNSSIPELTIDHQAPGKSGYSFNLEVAGKEPASPGPRAITRIVQESLPGADRIK
jgi:hypothetical protein